MFLSVTPLDLECPKEPHCLPAVDAGTADAFSRALLGPVPRPGVSVSPFLLRRVGQPVRFLHVPPRAHCTA